MKEANWMDLMTNPRGLMLKQFAAQLLEDRYPKYNELMERLSAVLVTDGDMEAFSKMLVDLFEKGYLRAVDDHRSRLAEMGIKSTVVPTKNPAGTPIGLHESESRHPEP
jgi:hypothetical protein